MPPAPPKPLSERPAAVQNPRHAGHRPEQRIAVGRHRVGMADERDDACVVQEREAPAGAVHELREALVVRRNGDAGVIPRHSVHPARNRVRLVAAEENPSGLRLAVDEIVEIPEARHLARQLVPVHAARAMCWWSTGTDGRERPHHRCHLGRPDPAGVHDSSVSTGPASVSTAVTSPTVRARIPVTRRPVSIRTPSSRAAFASVCVAMWGSTEPSPSIQTAP